MAPVRTPASAVVPARVRGDAESAAVGRLVRAQWTARPSQAGLTIAVTRAPRVARFAPEAVIFEAIALGFPVDRPPGATWYRPEMHEVFYEWDFGDPGATFTAPERTLDAFRDANRAFSQVAAHVYRRPGIYTVRCTARAIVALDPVEVVEATDTVTIDVADPEDVFAEDAGTTIVALDKDFRGRPARGIERWIETNPRTPIDWRRSVFTFGASGARVQRVLFKRGETYANPCWPELAFAREAVDAVYFGTWGDPDAPPPRFPRLGPNSINQSRGAAVIFDGLEVAGTYDPMTETPGPGPRKGAFLSDGGYMLLNDITFRNLLMGLHISHYSDGQQEFGPATIVMHNCALESLATYGVYATDRPDSVIAMLGCRDVDVGDAPQGGDGKLSGEGNEQGPMRLFTRGDVLVDGCDFFSRNGWSPGRNWPDDTPSTYAQACVRAFSTGSPDTDARLFVTRCAAEGGLLVSSGSTGRTHAPRGNMMIDMCMHVGDASIERSVDLQTGAVTVRNCLFIKPDVDGSIWYLEAVRADEIRKDERIEVPPENYAQPISVYNNTFMVLNRQGPIDPVRLHENWHTYMEANNVFYAPRIANQPGHTEFAPFDTTELWSVRWLGRLEYGDNGVLQTQFRAPDGTVSLYRPLAGSPVIGAATAGFASLYDLLGTPRGPEPSMGAVEPEGEPG